MKKMEGKKIVITGGAGFIGSNLAAAFFEENEVTVVDDLSTGNIKNIQSLIDAQEINYINGDVTDQDLLGRILKGIDYVFHEAAIPSVPRSIRDPLKTNNANITGTLVCLNAARKANVKRFIFASSSSVYGDTPTLPKHEGMTANPLSPYALTKFTGEQYCRLFSDIYGLSTISLRYFNVFGPHQNAKSEYAAVIPRFILRSMKEMELEVYGDGEQTRDFTFINDVVHANALAAESSETGIFNIASGRRISINEVAQRVSKILGKNVETRFECSRKGDVMHSMADISKAEKDLNYYPEFSFNEGLKKTISWFKANKISSGDD